MYDLFEHALHIAANGVGNPDVALTINRMVVGIFFMISGYHKLFNKGRHETMLATLKSDGVPFIRFNEWFVPVVEFVGGLAVTVGFFAPFFAVKLLVICLVACRVDGAKRVIDWKPIDTADIIDDILYLPETLYAIMLVVVIVAGPGVNL